MNQHYFDVPFAFAGDVTAIPDPLQVGGTVSMTEGWNNNYQRNLSTDPAALPIDRSTTNWLLLQISTALQALQQAAVPEFILASQNAGTAYSYGKGASVLWSASGNAPFVKYVSLTAGNTNTPSAGDPQGLTTGWQAVVDPISTAAQASAGTDDASIMTPLKVAQQTALRALLAGSSSQVFNVATATTPTQAVPLAQAQALRYQYQGTQNFSATTALTSSIAGDLVTWTGSSVGTLTLPAQSSITALTSVTFVNSGTAAVTVAAAGTDTININATTGATSFSVAPGEFATLVPTTTAGVWLVMQKRAGALVNVQTFTTTGAFTYTPTPGAIVAIADCQGAGGQGGGSPACAAGQNGFGTGGHSGSRAVVRISLAGVTSITGSVGVGGSVGAAGAAGQTGGTTTFGTYVSCPGGAGGGVLGPTTSSFIGGNSSALPTPTIAGVLQTLFNQQGNPGAQAMCIAVGTAISGTGGISPGYGGGIVGVNGTGAGSPGFQKGMGGSGAFTATSGAAQVGGAGASGQVTVYEFA